MEIITPPHARERRDDAVLILVGHLVIERQHERRVLRLLAVRQRARPRATSPRG